MEFKPKIFNEQTVFFLIAFPLIILAVLIILFFNSSIFDGSMSNMSMIYRILVLDGVITAVYICIHLSLQYLGRKLNTIRVGQENITIKSNNKIFNSKNYNFNIKDIRSIRFKWDITKSSGHPTLGRYLYWLIVKLKDGKETTIEMHAFDSSTLKKALHYISSKFPSIEIEPKYIETKPWKGELEELFRKKE